MPISTTTFQERVTRIEKRARKARRRRGHAGSRAGGFVVLVSMSMLVGGAALAWDGNTPAYEWAMPGLEWALAMLR